MSVEAAISNALYTGVSATLAASSIPAMPVKMPLRTFVTPNDGKYVEVVQIRNNGNNETWDTGKTMRGFVRLILHWPNNDAGAITPVQYVDELAAAIPKGSIFWSGPVSVKISDHPDAMSMIDTASDCLFPLSIEYQYFYTGT